MSDPSPGVRLGQILFKAGERATAIVKAGATGMSGGELLRVGDSDGELTLAGSGDIAVAVLADGQSIDANATSYAAVYFLGSVVKLRAGGAVARGSWVKPSAGGKVTQASSSVTIPSGGTAVTSTSAQPSMTVEGFSALGVALDSAAADGDLVRVVLR